MRKFLMTSAKITGQVAMLYDSTDQLVCIDFAEAGMSRDQKKFLLNRLPLAVDELQAFATVLKVTVVEAEVEITFEMFWNAYGKKINKARCLPLWNKMSKAVQVRALQGVKPYDAYLKRENWRNKMDPENYLRSYAWENEWK
jgi:hypothetical protein